LKTVCWRPCQNMTIILAPMILGLTLVGCQIIREQRQKQIFRAWGMNRGLPSILFRNFPGCYGMRRELVTIPAEIKYKVIDFHEWFDY